MLEKETLHRSGHLAPPQRCGNHYVIIAGPIYIGGFDIRIAAGIVRIVLP
jgi:hypothetical protein